MIYTRFGKEIIIIKGNIEKGEVDIKFTDGHIIKTYINELKATNGLKEIIDEIKNGNNKWEINFIEEAKP